MKVKVLLAVTGVLLLSVVLLCYWLWSWTGSLDSGSRRDGVTAQLMQRKTAATIDIRDGLAEGSFRHVERGASKLRQIGEASAWFVPDAQYGSLSDDFRDALSFLERALSRRDSTQLQKAYDHLIKSCVDCHRQASRYQIDPDTGAKASLQALRRQQTDMLVIARSFSPNPGWSCAICGFMGKARPGRTNLGVSASNQVGRDSPVIW
jgi:hypothetical protein